VRSRYRWQREWVLVSRAVHKGAAAEHLPAMELWAAEARVLVRAWLACDPRRGGRPTQGVLTGPRQVGEGRDSLSHFRLAPPLTIL